MEHEGGMVFIESLAELLRRLLDYRTVQQGDEYRDLQMHVMFNLLVSASVCVCMCACVCVCMCVCVCACMLLGQCAFVWVCDLGIEGVINYIMHR